MEREKKSKRTYAFANDRVRWLKAWLKMRNGDIPCKRKSFLTIFYCTKRAVDDREYAVISLRNCNNNLLHPLEDAVVDGIIEQVEAKTALPLFTNRDIVARLGITNREVEDLKIFRVEQEKALRADRRQAKRDLKKQIAMLYRQGNSVEDIAARIEGYSLGTIKRVVAKLSKQKKVSRNDRILELKEQGYSITDIAKMVGCSRDTIYNALRVEKIAYFTKLEVKRDEVGHETNNVLSEEGDFPFYKTETKQVVIDEQSVALSKLKNRKRNFALLGIAGTGKTYIINQYLEQLTPEEQKNTLIVAPTGIAANHIGGQTAHSVFQLPREALPNKTITESIIPEKLYSVDRIILDECGMMRIDIFTHIMRMIHYVERKAHKRIQVILVGDFSQVEPAASNEDKALIKKFYPKAMSLYAFDSPEWDKLHLQRIFLLHPKRQTDSYFQYLLEQIRIGNPAAIDQINNAAKYDFDEAAPTICAKNERVDYYNRRAIVDGFWMDDFVTYDAVIQGSFDPSDLPCPAHLELTYGMWVMTTVNRKNYNNGTIGHIIETAPNYVRIRKKDGTEITVKKELFKYENGATYYQIPVAPASAMTANKCQGCTFESINIERGFFAAGQLYTALSRVTSLDGLHLCKKLLPSDLVVNERALKMMQP